MAPEKLYGHRSEVDGPYGWLITFASLMAHVLIYGVTWSSGVYYDIFREMFSNGSGTISTIASLATAFTFGFSPITGILINRYGHRLVSVIGGLIAGSGLVLSAYASNIYFLTVSFGIITGIGFGTSYLAVIAIVPLYFDRWRTVALGIAVSGVGLGTFLYPPLIRILVHVYGVRGSLLITGGITFNICLCGALMRPPRTRKRKLMVESPSASSESDYSSASVTEKFEESNVVPQTGAAAEYTPQKSRARKCLALLNLHIFKNGSYVALCVNNFLSLFGICIVYVHITAFSDTSGISKDMSALLVSTIGISNFIGRPLFGFLAKIPCLTPLWLYIVSFTLCGVVVFIVPLMRSFIPLMSMMALFGLLSASIGPLLPQLISEFLSLSLIPSAYGYLLVFEAVGSMSGPALAGFLYDEFHLYLSSFYLGGAAILISGLVMIVPYILKKMADKRSAAMAGVLSIDVKGYTDNNEPVVDC